MFAVLIFVLSCFFTHESPRYLVGAGYHDKALENLAKLRNLPHDHEYVRNELSDMEMSIAHEREATAGIGFLGLLKEAFPNPSCLLRSVSQVPDSHC